MCGNLWSAFILSCTLIANITNNINMDQNQTKEAVGSGIMGQASQEALSCDLWQDI